MLQVRDAMDRAYPQPVDVAALARIACLSPAHLIRTFRATFGETPHRYLQQRRVERAMDEATAAQVRELVAKGSGGGWFGLATDDARATYETLAARGVELTEEPTERPYGIDFGVRDPFGNAIRIIQFPTT